MRLGFVTALADEARTLQFSDKDNAANARHDIEVAGVGIQNASQAATRLLDRGAEGLVSWGTAGALEPQLRPGTLLIYSAAHDISGSAYICDPTWRDKLSLALGALNPLEATGFTTEQAIASSIEKGAIRQRFGCAAVDMESAAVGAQANAAGAPFVAVRVIVDPANFDIPSSAIGALADNGEPRAWPVIRGLIRRPQELPALLKLARWYRISLTSLSRAANALQPDFGTQ